MRRLFLLLAILVLVSCDPFAPATPWIITATPGIVTNTPQTLTPGPSATEERGGETPTAEAANPHAVLPLYSRVNPNADLSNVPKQVLTVAGVAWDAPQGWEAVWRAAAIDPTPPPFLYKRTLGYQWEPENRHGEFGLQQSVMLYGDQRYIAKISFTSSLEGADNISLCLRVHNSDGGSSALRCQDFDNQGYNELVVAIETDADQPTVVIEWFADLVWATMAGTLTWQRIEVLTAPADWGEDALLRF